MHATKLYEETVGRLNHPETELLLSEAILCLQEEPLPRAGRHREPRLKNLGGGTAVAECGRKEGGFGRGLRHLAMGELGYLPAYLRPGARPDSTEVQHLLKLLCNVEVGAFEGESLYFGDLLSYHFELCSRRLIGQDARAPLELRFEILLQLVEAGEKLRILAVPGIVCSTWAKCVQFFLQGIFEDVVEESNARMEGLVAQTVDSLENQTLLTGMLERFPDIECCAEFDGHRATDHMKPVVAFLANLQLLESESSLRDTMIRYGPRDVYGVSLGVILAVQPCSSAYIDATNDVGGLPPRCKELGRTGNARDGHVVGQW